MNTLLLASNLNEVGTEIPDSMLGQRRFFRALDYSAVGTNKPVLHGSLIEAIAVKNESGGALTPGEIVIHSTSTQGVGEGCGAETSGTVVAMGVVPWCIKAAGVADDENFWLIKKGYCKFLSDGGDDVAAGAFVCSAASGQVTVFTPATTDAAYLCGQMIEAIGDTAAVLKAGLADFRF